MLIPVADTSRVTAEFLQGWAMICACRWRMSRAVFVLAAFVASGTSVVGDESDTLLRQVIEKVSPAVVTVEVPSGQGSGFLVDEKGLVVTNLHVVSGASEAKVIFSDKSTSAVSGFTAVSVGRDLAVLKLKSVKGKTAFLRIAKDDPAAGERVVAFGSPKSLRGTVADGIVSAVRSGSEVRDVLNGSAGRDVYAQLLGFDLDATWIQTTAPISAGNSGGPLVNKKGEVIGITTWTRADAQNLNFAISAQHVRELLARADTDVRPLRNLPESNFRGNLPGKADGQRTLDYWNARAKIDADRIGKLRKLNSLKTPAEIARFGGGFSKAAAAYALEASRLDISGVDERLVDATNAHVILVRNLGSAWSAEVDAIKAKDERTATKQRKRIEELTGEIDDVYHARFADLRQELSERYGLRFPHYQGSPLPVDKKTETTAPTVAASTLKIAQDLLKLGRREAARRYLEEVANEYPGSDEANEANKILEMLDKD
ncbi:MAG: trypsin-like peptidase domain-containing protein [Planctomycetaceae bacterium]